MGTIMDGTLLDSRIRMRIFPNLERGCMKIVHAIVIHQTDSSSAVSTLNQYKTGTIGAHFLIDKDGTIYQTVRVNRKANHIGWIKSRCYEEGSCSNNAATEYKTYHEKGKPWFKRQSNLYYYEKNKTYPNRYPTNDDSIGIEVVGKFNAVVGQFEGATAAQVSSLKILVGELEKNLAITNKDLYSHGSIGRKQQTEGISIMQHIMQ